MSKPKVHTGFKSVQKALDQQPMQGVTVPKPKPSKKMLPGMRGGGKC